MHRITLNKGPVKSIRVLDVVEQWNPKLTHNPSHSYINMEESEVIRNLKGRISDLDFQINNERDAAFKKGYEDGAKAVAGDVRKLMDTLPKQFANVTADLKEQLDIELKKLREPLLDFSLSVAEQLMGKSLKIDENQNEMLLKNINEFLDKVKNQTNILVRVNPQHIEWISKEDTVKNMNASVRETIRFMRDPSLNPGECVLETEDFNIEGIVNKQIASLKEHLLGEESIGN